MKGIFIVAGIRVDRINIVVLVHKLISFIRHIFIILQFYAAVGVVGKLPGLAGNYRARTIIGITRPFGFKGFAGLYVQLISRLFVQLVTHPFFRDNGIEAIVVLRESIRGVLYFGQSSVIIIRQRILSPPGEDIGLRCGKDTAAAFLKM